MNKPIVVLADLDANYLVSLEDKLTEELYDQIDLEIITDQSYFDLYFQMPKRIDTLIISSALYSQDLMRHNITNIFVLTENPEDVQSVDNVTRIFKYSSTKEIFNQVLFKNQEMHRVELSYKETQVIAVTSAIGGAGKTTVAMALSLSLARNHKRVLFISTDIMQGFSYYLQNKSVLPNDVYRVFNSAEETIYKDIMPYLRNEEFTYLPPFSRSILSVGLDFSIYNKLIQAAKNSKEYDYIVVDTDVQLDEHRAVLIQKADKVMINILQDSMSTWKTESLVRNIDCSNTEKFVFIANKFRRDINNDYILSQLGQQFIITEYIDEIPNHQRDSIGAFSDLTGIRNLSYSLI